MKNTTKDEYKYRMSVHPFKDVEYIRVDPFPAMIIENMADESNLLSKELGGIGCIVKNGRGATITDFKQVRQRLRSDSYSWNEKTLESATINTCPSGQSALFHTHPSGSIDPSNADRVASVMHGIIGCVVVGSDISCHVGHKDIKTFKN